jgi:hypothetical protein
MMSQIKHVFVLRCTNLATAIKGASYQYWTGSP